MVKYNLEKIEKLQEALTVQETINLITKTQKNEIIENVYSDIKSSNISNDELIIKYNFNHLRSNCTLDEILKLGDIEILRSLLMSRLSELSADLYDVVPTILFLEESLIGNAKMLLKTLSDNYDVNNIAYDVYEILAEPPKEDKGYIKSE